jgi:hypothetical protein
VGSIVGTLLTGFYLTAWMGSVRIVVSMALLLAVLGLCYALAARRSGGSGRDAVSAAAGLAVFLALFLLAVLPGETLGAVARTLKLRDVPAEDNAIFFAETQYQILTVTAEAGNPAHRAFYQDKLRHSEADLSDWGDLKYPYMRIYDALVNKKAGKNTAPVRLLLLGGGGYVFPNYLFRERPGSEIVVVEIDPGVTRAAQEAFGLPRDAPIEIHHMDARNYVADALRRNRERPAACRRSISSCATRSATIPCPINSPRWSSWAGPGAAQAGRAVHHESDRCLRGRRVHECHRPDLRRGVCVSRGGFRHFRTGLAQYDRVCRGQRFRWTLTISARGRRGPASYAGMVLTDGHFADLRARNGECVLTDDWAPVENLLAPVVRTDSLGCWRPRCRRGSGQRRRRTIRGRSGNSARRWRLRRTTRTL